MSPAIGFSVFDTALGHCGIAWSAAAIAGTRLPETSIEDIQRRYGEAKLLPPPPFVHEAIQRIRHLLAGEADDLPVVAAGLRALLTCGHGKDHRRSTSMTVVDRCGLWVNLVHL